MTPLELTEKVAKFILDLKGLNIVIQDLQGHSDICNYQLICSGTNNKQTKAIADHIESTFRTQFGTKPIIIEGKETGSWILMDYGGAIIHIFEQSVRDYYAIDKLWPKANSVTY